MSEWRRAVVSSVGVIAAFGILLLALDLQWELTWARLVSNGFDVDDVFARTIGRVHVLNFVRGVVLLVLIAGIWTVWFRPRTGAVLVALGACGGAASVWFTFTILGAESHIVRHYTELFFGTNQESLSGTALILCAAAFVLAPVALRSSRSGTRRPPAGIG